MNTFTFIDLINTGAATLMIVMIIADERVAWRLFYALLLVVNVAFVVA